LQRFHRDLIGRTPHPDDLEKVIDFLIDGVAPDPHIRAMAEGIQASMERARQMFNEAGGDIPKLDRWGLPQLHDERAIVDAGFEKWRDFLTPLLDRERMIDGDTGAPMSDARLEILLRETFDAMATDGWSRRAATGSAHGRAKANQRQDHRFLHFRDADAWRAYNREFGEGNAWTAVLGYLDGMSRDIALMQRFGPNPNAGAEYARQLVQREAGLSRDPRAIRQAHSATRDMDTMHRHFTGQNNVPDHGKTALFFGSVRQVLSSAQLGGAMISALSDANFGRLTAKYNGMESSRLIRRQLSLINPANEADRQLAIRMGLIADEASQLLSGYARYFDDITASGWTQRMADATMRLSGLSGWTQAGRWAFGMEYLGMLADHAGKSLDELDPAIRNSLTRHGVAGDWDRIRLGPIADHKGARFIDPSQFEDQDLALRLLAGIRAETEFAVPSVSLYGRARTIGNTAPGSIAGEFLRNTMLYKSFGITLMLTHGRRAAMQAGWEKKIGYAGSLILTSSAMGAMVIQLKDMLNGKDPRDMGSAQFVFASLIQGGGFGIFGDFLFSDTNRFGGSFGETLAGPVASAATDAHRLTIDNLMQIFEEDGLSLGDVGADAMRAIENYTPIASSLWYTRLATQRLIFDQMRKQIDPEAEDRFDRAMRSRERNYGSEYWWEPGSGAPARGPELAPVAASGE
jgi:hypothetical protein